MYINLIQCDVCKTSQCQPENTQKEGWKPFSAGFEGEDSIIDTPDTCPTCQKKLRSGLPDLLEKVSRPWNQLLPPSGNSTVRRISIEAIEQEHILAILDDVKWNKSQAAHILEIERSTLDRKLLKYGVTRPSSVNSEN